MPAEKSPWSWITAQISALILDYRSYNKLLERIILLAERPLRSDLTLHRHEESHLSAKILKAETILACWLKEAPFLEGQNRAALDRLQALRRDCGNLLNKGRCSLKTGLTLLDREQRRCHTAPGPKFRKKEAVPRLIDIQL